uniref:RING-type domain-containing protein n=1 Tax=Ditylum brightwellii TaxID=49249 RepID=A0A7S4T2D0_9STRA|mmetsp:Transcript_30946/g.41309  ORF Transcript_30946/g.41309 Transcript_30946/m.41309 type:complete len:241 (+) Transcript_30946:70-792(+)
MNDKPSPFQIFFYIVFSLLVVSVLYIIYLRCFKDFRDGGGTNADSEQTREEETLRALRAQGRIESDETIALWTFARTGQHDDNEDGVNGSAFVVISKPEERRSILEKAMICQPFAAGHASAEQEKRSADTFEDEKDTKVEAVEEGRVKTTGSSLDEVVGVETEEHGLNLPYQGSIDECPICVEKFTEGQMINVSNKCSHVFHKDCIMSWLERHIRCPCCRTELFTKEELNSAHEAASSPA